MPPNVKSPLAEVISRHQDELLAEWVREQMTRAAPRAGVLREPELRDQCAEFLRLLGEALGSGGTDARGPAFAGLRDLLADVSRSRSQQGFTPSETAGFVFSFKKPLFGRLAQALSGPTLFEQTWAATELLDTLGLFTTEVYQKTREEVIVRQQQELLELSTPVVELWEGVLALPVIGTLDSARTQVVMESLLQKIVDTGSEVAIIDITGVPTVDTLTAQHLLKTVTAARLMGADCIISGIRPQIAQTIVHLGVDLKDVITKATLADAFTLALQRAGQSVVGRRPPREGGR